MLEDPEKILSLCEFGGLDRVVGDITCQELAELIDPFGTPALHHAAATGQLKYIKGGVTAKQLAECRDTSNGNTGLHIAAMSEALGQISGGVTAEDLIGAKNDQGGSALYMAVHYATLELIQDGVTLQQLIEARDSDGISSILASHSWVDHVREDLIFDQLAEVKDSTGRTAIHLLASNGLLERIRGGITAAQLADLKDAEGRSALDEALIMCPLSQIIGGLPSGLLSTDELNSLLREAFETEYTNAHLIENIRAMILVGADKGIILEFLRDEVSIAELETKIPDWQIQKLRFLWRLAQDYDPDVSGILSPTITTQLL